MELSGTGYLYTLATLAMTFVGFSAIVLIFRQSLGAKSANVHRIHSHIEMGFLAAAFAMLAPLLATCGLPYPAVWRISSVIIAIVLLAHTVFILKRFKATNPGPLPMRVWVNSTITIFVLMGLLANTSGILVEPSVGPVAIAATWRLVMGVEIFMVTLERSLGEASRKITSRTKPPPTR